mmetsp:Transcript_37435/g.87916  ORF Transcript_37435/g.87916 Transcript_37435/m.87916 type:complete len:204 (+) Transcript_37435:114-725(+)
MQSGAPVVDRRRCRPGRAPRQRARAPAQRRSLHARARGQAAPPLGRRLPLIRTRGARPLHGLRNSPTFGRRSHRSGEIASNRAESRRRPDSATRAATTLRPSPRKFGRRAERASASGHGHCCWTLYCQHAAAEAPVQAPARRIIFYISMMCTLCCRELELLTARINGDEAAAKRSSGEAERENEMKSVWKSFYKKFGSYHWSK